MAVNATFIYLYIIAIHSVIWMRAYIYETLAAGLKGLRRWRVSLIIITKARRFFAGDVSRSSRASQVCAKPRFVSFGAPEGNPLIPHPLAPPLRAR